MTDRTVQFDKSFWPKSGTVIDEQRPNDLNDLWDDHQDAASCFIAEALIDNPPRIDIDKFGNQIEVETFLWECGGDGLTSRAPLDELIMEYAEIYLRVGSQEQADDVKDRIAALERIENAITAAKAHMKKLLADYDGEKQHDKD